MDFMKWLNSLDEFLYEVVGWLAFFPLTIWRVVRRPVAMMGHAERQLELPVAAQFVDVVRPPLFLVLALLTAHGVGVALGQADEIVQNRRGLAGLISDDATALLFRVVLFAAFPLTMAARLVRRTGGPFDRETLRGPFYAQCYPTAVFALGLSLAGSLGKLGGAPAQIAGGLLATAALAFQLAAETRWFAARLRVAKVKAFLLSVAGLAEGFLVLLGVGLLVAR